MRPDGFRWVSSAAATVYSVAVTSTTAAAAATPPPPFLEEKCSKESAKTDGAEAGEKKFAPRFDGLRFIETLVTAHR